MNIINLDYVSIQDRIFILDAKKNSHNHKNANNWRISLGCIFESTLKSLSCYMYKQDKCKWVYPPFTLYHVFHLHFTLVQISVKRLTPPTFVLHTCPKFLKLWIHTIYIWSMKIEYWFCLTQHVIVHSKHMLNISFIHGTCTLYMYIFLKAAFAIFGTFVSWKRCMIDPKYIIYIYIYLKRSTLLWKMKNFRPIVQGSCIQFLMKDINFIHVDL